MAWLRLFCFPYGGVGPSIFRAWPRDLGPGVELYAVQLPGRESRFREPLFTRLANLVHPVADALRPYLDVPFALFGHSMGALIAFEVARELRRRQAGAAVHFFASARRAPQRPEPFPPIHEWPDSAFVDEVRRRFDGIPDAVMKEPELLGLLLPALRADFAMLETYVYVDEDPLECPISVFGGLEDRTTSHADLAAWREQTRGGFTLEMFPGNHFFLQNAQGPLISAVSRTLRAATGR